MAKSLFIALISCFFLGILLLNFVSAEVEENVYVTFNGENAHIKQVITFYATGGYYLPSFTYSDIFYPEQKNLQIHDSEGKIPLYKIVEANESYTVYNITIPQVGSSYSYGLDFLPSTYYLYYEYDQEGVLINYLKNFEANIALITNDDEYTRRVYFCLPSSSSSYITYDSRPYEETTSYNPYQLKIPELVMPSFNITTLVPFNAPKEPEPNFCSSGNKKRVYQERYTYSIDIANHKWSDANSYKTLNEIQGDKITLSIPEDYSENQEILKRTQEILPYLDTINLKQQDHYYVYIVDSDDKVLSSKEEGIVCYEDGKCYITNEILYEEDQLQTFNVISAYFLTSFLKTYGQELDTQNWYIQGASNYFGLKSMEYANLPNDKIKEFLDANISEWYGEGFISSDIERQIRMIENTKIVSEIESTCPDHTRDIVTALNSNGIFSSNIDETGFNNLILSFYGEYCNLESLIPIFEKRDMSFNKERIETYLSVKKEISNSKFNWFKGNSEQALQNSLIQTEYNADESLKSAVYWKDNGRAYTIGLIIGLIVLVVGLILGVIYYVKRRKHRIKEHLRNKQHNEIRGERRDMSHNLKKEVKNAGIILIVLGFIHFVLSGLLDPLWGIVLIIVGIIALFYRSRNMLLVFGILLILVGILNIFSSISAIETSGFWLIFAIFQIYWGIKEIRVFVRTK